MFETIKSLCTAISMGQGNIYSQKSRNKSSMSEDMENDLNTFLGRSDEILKIASNIGICAYQDIVSSGIEVCGKRKDFFTFMQFFEKDAPMLLELANHVGQQFEIQVLGKSKGQMELKVAGPPKVTLPDTFISANYFITSEISYGVDSSSGELTTIEGQQLGGASPTDDGWILGINVEVKLSLDILVHEMMHAKLPEGLPQQICASIDPGCSEISKILSKLGYDDLQNEQGLQEELTQTIATFQAFDSALKDLGLMLEKFSNNRDD